jgi:two-component system phosphate regulon response regulator PhoB
VTEQPKKLVILMEDDDDIARLISYHLELAGFRVHRPDRSSDLINNAEKQHPGLFILDLMLPGMDGFQLCRALRANVHLRGIPILVLTARTGIEDRQRAFASGADQYITKPFKPSALIETIRSLTKQNS